MTKTGLVFISCGQFTAQEKKLGQDVSVLIHELTPYEPYFAESQTSLDALTRNILGALDKAVALVAIMHPRGTVRFPDNREEIRASVWIEQEIAMAAYITQILGRPIKIAPYIHRDILREGMREQLQLNAVRFTEDSEVLHHLRQLLPSWSDLHIPIKGEDPFHGERLNIAAKEIGKLEKPNQEALRLLLQYGSMTDYSALQKLHEMGTAANYASVFPGLQNTTSLVRPVPGQPPTRQPEYETNWEIKPEFRSVVREYFAEQKNKS
jgi:hypothetical protein